MYSYLCHEAALYGKLWYKPLFIEGTVTDNVPEEVWKVKKITFLSLNKAVLSNIYGTDRKQGQRRTFIDIMIGGGCHRIQVMGAYQRKTRHCVGRKCLSLDCPEVFSKEQQAVFHCVSPCFV